jgi:hypothetical protein
VKRAPPTSAQATATVSAGNRTLAFTGLSPSVTARASTDGASGGPFSLQIAYMATRADTGPHGIHRRTSSRSRGMAEPAAAA